LPETSGGPAAELRRLAADADAQATYAVTLLTPRTPRSGLQAALAVLQRNPQPDARNGLLAVYAHVDADGPRRDPGGYLRRALLNALRPIALPADTALLLRAVTTSERMPPSFEDEAVTLRSTALVILNQVDDGLAAFHAARLLEDPNTDKMSGEPALTAARVLASQENLLPLYAYAMRDGSPVWPEVVGECLRSLTAIPVSLLPGIVERHGQSGSTIILVGLCDLLIGHSEGPQQADLLRDLLATARDEDLTRYLALALLTSRDEQLLQLTLEAAQLETRPTHIAALCEALDPYAHDPQVGEALAVLQEKQRLARAHDENRSRR